MANKQCERCAVTVSQTKIGVCLQLEWIPEDDYGPEDKFGGEPVYCSIDLIPTFNIRYNITQIESYLKAFCMHMRKLFRPINPMRLARIVNSAMLSPDHPPGWLNYLENYAKRRQGVARTVR